MRIDPVWLLLAGGACAAPDESTRPDPRVATVEAFVAARERGDLDAARALMAPDPRLWFDEVEGEGSSWNLEGGRWKAWDEHFRGHTERLGPWVAEDDRVWAEMQETNDYFRLTEARAAPWRANYLFDEQGRIRGFLLSPVPGAVADRGRRDEFEAWAREHRPDEAEYLMPGGSLDPSGDRPPRMRALLLEWRADVGLPPLP